MRQTAPDQLWVLLSRKLSDHLSEAEEVQLTLLMDEHEEASLVLQVLNCCREPEVNGPRVHIAYTRHISRKSLFMSVMKKIAKDLELALTDFLQTDVLSKDWNYKAGPDKWTKKEIIGHLIDSAQINLQRFVRSTYTENSRLTYDQVAWVDAQHYDSADISELLDLWRLLNRQIIRVLENYPSERLQIQCDTGSTTPSFHSVEFLARDYVNHLNHHLKSIELL